MSEVKNIIGVVLASAMLILLSVVPAKVNAAVVEDQEQNKVTICHRTNSVKNPYVEITVDKSAVDGEGNNDHTSHTGPIATSEEVAQNLKNNKQKWGDIIPPFDEYPGYNWTEAGQAIYRNGCGEAEITEVVPAVVTFADPTCDEKGYYTVPSTTGVDYLVNGEVVSEGKYSVANGTSVTVSAEAQEDYYIADGTTDSWTHEFKAPTNCDGSVLSSTTPQVTSKPVGAVNAGEGASTSVIPALGLAGSMMGIFAGYFLNRKFQQ